MSGSYSESSPGKVKPKKTFRTKTSRSPSASEISRNARHFEVWCTYQNLERASFEDIPENFKKEVEDVFNVRKRLPLDWVDKESEGYKRFSSYAPAEFIDFIAEAYAEDPSLFGADLKAENLMCLYLTLATVFGAWKHLKSMLNSSQAWSEADFATAYAIFRTPAISASTLRTQCAVSLPQPLLTQMDSDAARILSTRKLIPDCVVTIPEKSIRHLSKSTKSAFKRLKAHKAVAKTGDVVKDSSFPFQATIMCSLPDPPAFEFCSSVWEDKKPGVLLEHAYRQNRMSTASAVRHLNSMHVEAPVFGLVWARGNVRAHIDWCKRPKPETLPVVYSAPYVRPTTETRGEDDDKDYHEWHLGRASDILHLHFLIVNIDLWTIGEFQKRVVDGVAELAKSVEDGNASFQPWRRFGDIVPRSRQSLSVMESAELSAHILMHSTPPKNKRKPKARAIR